MAKAVNFGFIYGMQAMGFVTYAREVYSVEVNLEEAEAAREKFFSTWQGLEEWHNRYEWIAYENEEVVSPLGRRRLLPHARSKGPIQMDAMRQAINSPVQSMASDLMLLSMIEIDKRVSKDRARIVGTVHDSTLFEVRERGADLTIDKIAWIMRNPNLDPFGIEFDIPLVVDATIGTHWADESAKELEYAA